MTDREPRLSPDEALTDRMTQAVENQAGGLQARQDLAFRLSQIEADSKLDEEILKLLSDTDTAVVVLCLKALITMRVPSYHSYRPSETVKKVVLELAMGNENDRYVRENAAALLIAVNDPDSRRVADAVLQEYPDRDQDYDKYSGANLRMMIDAYLDHEPHHGF